MIDLREIKLGAPAAERDQALAEYFVESDAYERIRKGKKYIVLGNRGSGKSAIFRVLAEREKLSGGIVLSLSPEDYSYEILNTVMKKESEGAWAKQGAYTAAWKFVLYVEIMKALNKAGLIFKHGASARIYNYLRDTFEGQQSNPIGLLVSYVKRLESIKIGKYEAAAKTKDLEKLYRLEEITELLPSIIELCSKKNVLVLIDELDKGWDSSEDAKSFIAGLFQAAVSLNTHSEHLRVVMSLRQELYDSIPSLYEDAQKYRDVMEVVSWDESSLLELVAKRIRYKAPQLRQETYQHLWNMVFSETLDYRQTKSFNYFVDRTLYRPREIIQFCTDAIESTISMETGQANYQTITHAELMYSQGRTQDIAAEYRFQYPGLLSIFEVFRGRAYSFTREEAEDVCLRISIGSYNIDKAASWTLNQEPEFLIDFLWRIGFFRALALGGIKAKRRSGSQYLGPHQIGTLNLANSPRFQVHPMFRAFLSMKEAKGNYDQDE